MLLVAFVFELNMNSGFTKIKTAHLHILAYLNYSQVWLIFPMITATFGIYMFIIPWFSKTRAMNALWLAITIVGGIPVYFACVNKKYRIQALVNFSGWCLMC